MPANMRIADTCRYYPSSLVPMGRFASTIPCLPFVPQLYGMHAPRFFLIPKHARSPLSYDGFNPGKVAPPEVSAGAFGIAIVTNPIANVRAISTLEMPTEFVATLEATRNWSLHTVKDRNKFFSLFRKCAVMHCYRNCDLSQSHVLGTFISQQSMAINNGRSWTAVGIG